MPYLSLLEQERLYSRVTDLIRMIVSQSIRSSRSHLEYSVHTAQSKAGAVAEAWLKCEVADASEPNRASTTWINVLRQNFAPSEITE